MNEASFPEGRRLAVGERETVSASSVKTSPAESREVREREWPAMALNEARLDDDGDVGDVCEALDGCGASLSG